MTSSMPSTHTFRVAHALHLIDVIKRWEVTGDQLLEGTGLTQQALLDPHGLLAVEMMVTLVERARVLTGEPALGVYTGLQTRATLYGNVGFAIVSASTIREAIEVSLRYGRIITTALSVRFRTNGRTASLIVDEHADFGPARDSIIMSTLVSLWQVSRSLTGRELTTSVAELALPEPHYVDRLKACPLPMRFGRHVHQLTFDARSLDLPYTMPDPVAAKLAREQCQRELDGLDPRAALATRVRALIARPEGGSRSLGEVAAQMCRSPRTLKRQLGAEGISFSALRERELGTRAMVMLRSPNLSLAEIAFRVGYSNTSSFERAFHRWTGQSPAEFRRAGTTGSDIGTAKQA
jgi:AraC-like DNA-binding protein